MKTSVLQNLSISLILVMLVSQFIGCEAAATPDKPAQIPPETSYASTFKAAEPAGSLSPVGNTLTVSAKAVAPVPSAQYRVVAYYTAWSAYSGFTPDKIAAGNLTHINYAFANIGSDLRIQLGDAGIDPANFTGLNSLKKSNPGLKTLISVGGWSWSGKFSDVALSDGSRTLFADSCVDFIVKYGFNGVDIDWEYPVSGGLGSNVTRPADRHNFTELLKKLRERLNARDPQYLLTVAGGAGQGYFDNTEMDSFTQYLDFANIMAYDIHGAWDRNTDFNAPLHPDAASPQARWSVDQGLQLWLKAIPAEKIVVGIPFYGRKYTAVKSINQDYPGLYGTYGRCETITYQDIVKTCFSNSNFKTRFHITTSVPYLFDGSTFISYDDAQSIGKKTAYIQENHLGGVMVWELSQDNNSDLIRAVFNGLN